MTREITVSTVFIFALTLTTAGAQRHSAPNDAQPPVASEQPVQVRRAPSAEQRANLEARIAAAQAIVDRLAVDAKRRGAGNGWRQATLETLLGLSLDGLAHVEQNAFTLDGLTRATREAGNDPRLLGDPNRDLVYRPIVPCRYIDTRNGAGKVDGVRGYNLGDNGAMYGGSAACAPKTVFGVANEDQLAAIAMNVTIVDPSAAPGFVAVKPAAASPTVSLINWYEPGAAVQAANQAIVSTLQDNAVGDEFVVQSSAPVHVIVDLFGAFVAGPSHMFAYTWGYGAVSSSTAAFLGAPTTVTVSNSSQRVLVIASVALGTSALSAQALNLFICYRAVPGSNPIVPVGNGLLGIRLPASTTTVQSISKALELPVGTYEVGACGTAGANWTVNDGGMTTAFVF